MKTKNIILIMVVFVLMVGALLITIKLSNQDELCATFGQSCGYSEDAPMCCNGLGLRCQNFGCYPEEG